MLKLILMFTFMFIMVLLKMMCMYVLVFASYIFVPYFSLYVDL